MCCLFHGATSAGATSAAAVGGGFLLVLVYLESPSYNCQFS